ncbi:MAG: hypothetical protein WCT08_02605 [Patescibacteria group bacterium]|jgi:hypothetical protein
MNYRFGILDPRQIPAAEENNAKVLGPSTLGVEVTVPALATRCGLGNIDPQHSDGQVDLAAIEVALTAELQPDGATLVTNRADLDAVGTMAVFSLRAKGVELTPETLERFRLIAEADKFARGGWSGPRLLPTVEQLFDDSMASADTDSRLAPMSAAIGDFKIPIADRVAWMEHWLLTGEEPDGYRDRWLAERRQIAEAIANGSMKVELAADGQIATVVSTHRAATTLGYCLAPVVIALNPEFRVQGSEAHPKFTVCQFQVGHADLVAAKKDLAAKETGWGGSPTIIGSPQGVGSSLTLEEVIEVVARHLK